MPLPEEVQGANRPPRRRVLFIVPSLEGGGAERVVTHLLRGLSPDRFDRHLALLAASGPYLSEVPPGVVLHDLGDRRIRNAALPLVRLIRRLRPDVVVPTLPPLNLLVLGLRPFLPRRTLLMPRESILLRDAMEDPRYVGLWRRASRRFYRRAAVVICPAQAMGDELERELGLPADRIARIPNPVDTDAIARRAAEGGAPFAGAGPHLVGIGRLVPQKGFDRLIAMLPRFAAGQAQMWILGAGPDEADLRAAAARHSVASRVHFQGFAANPYVWLRHADLFVQASRFEGMPNALLEALACGTRVVAFDSPGGTREILAGLDGTALVPDGDAAAFVAAVDRMLGPGRPAAPALPARYTFANVLARYERLFSDPAGRA